MRTPGSFLLKALTGLALLLTASAHSNNITTSTGSLTGNTGTTVLVQFNVSWENSWRINPDRWDAAWIFVKYRSTDGLWRHASLSNTGHVAPTGSVITTGLLNPAAAYNASTNPGLGVFLYRSSDGSGTFAVNGVQLLWNYSVNGVSLGNVLEVRVFATEMVFVPTGAFAAGSGGVEFNAFTLTTINTATATTAPAGSGSLGGQAGGYPTGQTAPANAAWPNGYNAFYCMKYELSQQACVDFLNTLTYAQQATRTLFASAPNDAAGTSAFAGATRNGIAIQTPGVASTVPAVYACNLNNNGVYGEAGDGKEIACNALDWGGMVSYLDWSGLRPMTELEYEKACRGTALPVPNEYPWGAVGIASTNYTLNNPGTASEGIATNYSTTQGNAINNVTKAIGVNEGQVRGGIFAANPANSGRVSAGATYYGIMEMAGNLWELDVTIGNANGKAYTGAHGNGMLATSGDANVTAWPLSLSDTDGAGIRGTAWDNPPAYGRVSDRVLAVGQGGAFSWFHGTRGVRTQ